MLNSDSQQFHQYLQYKQLYLDSNQQTQGRQRQTSMAIQFTTWNKVQGVNWFNMNPNNPPLDNCISRYTNINGQ